MFTSLRERDSPNENLTYERVNIAVGSEKSPRDEELGKLAYEPGDRKQSSQSQEKSPLG